MFNNIRKFFITRRAAKVMDSLDLSKEHQAVIELIAQKVMSVASIEFSSNREHTDDADFSALEAPMAEIKDSLARGEASKVTKMYLGVILKAQSMIASASTSCKITFHK